MGGLIPNFVGIFRELVYMNRDRKKWASVGLWPVVFILINLGLALTGTKEPLDYLPVVASCFVTISLWLRRPKLTKVILAGVCTAYLIYDIFVGSIPGLLNESISLVSVAIYFIKEWKKKKFRVCTFISGKEQLIDLTKELLVHNQKVLAEQESNENQTAQEESAA
jgi:hypothetical protein